MTQAITTGLMIIASVIAAMALVNAVIPAANRSSGALLTANAAASDRIKTDIEIVHASGNAATNEIIVWVKNIGSHDIPLVTASDVLVDKPGGVTRLGYVSGCTSECWDYEIEGSGSDWTQTVTVKFTISTSVVVGVYTVTVSVYNAVSAIKDFSV